MRNVLPPSVGAKTLACWPASHSACRISLNSSQPMRGMASSVTPSSASSRVSRSGERFTGHLEETAARSQAVAERAMLAVQLVPPIVPVILVPLSDPGRVLEHDALPRVLAQLAAAEQARSAGVAVHTRHLRR